MPGGRLTHQDRRRIAGWLAEGLGYAEIARRLGRPTSTVSREVARNGTSGDYLPDRAQQSAARRARRGRPAQAAQPPDDGRPGSSEVARDFTEHFAALLAVNGLPRMVARVFVRLLTTDSGSLTAADLVRRLRVSPASVSKAIRYLEAMDLVGREPDPGGRRQRYVIDDGTWMRAWQTDTGAHATVAEAARRGVEIFGAGTPAGERLDQMGQFFTWLSDEMRGSDLTDHLVRDALTVLAALVHAARPLTAADLAGALDLPPRRTTDALDLLEQRPNIADPLVLRRAGSGAYTVTTRPDRLSPAQREALHVRDP
ncbi:GbsR/MarR family transcriptional regulator [Nonomuraea rhizosphaerae]|uniref:GbsR/MarR family transcriptional regulator n=1 Tax=Nonomuraea rhizosphaerae TaxID=2665663 RepID=UPI001C601E54|nr:MarR family transcriptional regulator [Nonomuraea rhizosphaerae]